jgi:hypothetical protein
MTISLLKEREELIGRQQMLQKLQKSNENVLKAPLFSSERLPLSSKITPHWLSSWKGKKALDIIKKVFFEIGKTFLFFTLVIPAIAFVKDVVKFSTEKPGMEKVKKELESKIVEVKANITANEAKIVSHQKMVKAMCIGGTVIAVAAVVFASWYFAPALAAGLRSFANSTCPFVNGTRH